MALTHEPGLKKRKVVSRDEWNAARAEFLKKEKDFTKQRDAMAAELRELPWVKVEKNYIFDTNEGKKSLSDLFEGRSQLITYHFMFGPDWDEGCDGCSFVSDHVDCARQHFEHHDISYVAISRAPLDKLNAYKKRMGWTFRWVSSDDGDFNYDFQGSFRQEDLQKGPVYYNFKMQKLTGDEQPGLSVFYKDENGDIYHTYSTYERGLDILLGAYHFIDMTPIGRNEKEGMGDWMKRHDEY